MPQHNIPQSLPSVEKLLARISSAERSQQKEIRVTIQEARELAVELSMLAARLGSTLSEINQSLERLESSNGNIKVKFDGGGF